MAWQPAVLCELPSAALQAGPARPHPHWIQVAGAGAVGNAEGAGEAPSLPTALNPALFGFTELGFPLLFAYIHSCSFHGWCSFPWLKSQRGKVATIQVAARLTLQAEFLVLFLCQDKSPCLR